MNTLYLDLETFNANPLKWGTARYAETVEVMLIGWAWNAEPVQLIDLTGPMFDPNSFNAAWHAADRIVAHNSYFDRTCLNANLEFKAPIEKWHCTMARAYAHSLPGGLDALCDIFKISEGMAKKKDGRGLVMLFCKPRPKNTKERRATSKTHPEQWQRFKAYCKQDVEALRVIDQKLPRWNWSKIEEQLWFLDQIINDRGMMIDADLARAALATVRLHKGDLQEQTHEITGTDLSVTQRDALLAHLLAEYGVELPNMQASTLERRIDDENLPEPVRELLRIRLETCQTSNTKWTRLLQAINTHDGRLRGASQFCGASRTGRSAGRVFQPLNLPRPPRALKKLIPFGIEAMKLNIADLCFSDPSALASACLRGAVIAAPGHKLCIADLSNIEGRVLAWLAYEVDKCNAFDRFDAGVGHDIYILGAAGLFQTTPEKVLEDEEAGGKMRLIGKVQELALGYQGAVGAFGTMAKGYGLELPEKRILEIVKAWRKLNRNIVEFWYELEDAFKQVLATRGEIIECRRLKLRRDGPWVRIILPSGRALCYPHAGIDDKGKPYYYGVNQYSRKWDKINTYGGKLVENITQAAARDVLTQAMPKAESAGFPIVLHVYDELATEVPINSGLSVAGLCDIMTAPIAWAPGLPLAAKGFETDRYRKD